MNLSIKLTGIVSLLFLSVNVFADSFDIYLPTASRFSPGTIGEGKWGFSIGVMKEVKDFRLQYDPVTEENQHVSEYATYSRDVMVYLTYGLTDSLDIELGGEKGSYLSFKYDFDMGEQSNWNSSFVVGWLKNEHEGHAGAVIQQGEDCGWFDIFCSLFSDPKPTIYEYGYEADINGLMLGYFHGYKFSDRVMAYLGGTYTDYRIEYYLHDNTIAGLDQAHKVDTDVVALWLGAKIQVGKKNNKFVTANYDVLKDSTRHDGNMEGRLNFVFSFVY